MTPLPFRSESGSPEPFVLAFRKQELLLIRTGDDAGIGIPVRSQVDELRLKCALQTVAGHFDGTIVEACALPPETETPEGWRFQDVRALFGLIDERLFGVVGRGAHLINWRRTHQFCGQCGAVTAFDAEAMALRCPNCALEIFPRIAPAVIVLVEAGDTCLLARGKRFQQALYSCLAGFVEPGETLEDAVRREVFEETGLQVDDLQYFASQPWPFPDGLMIGFRAIHAGGEIHLRDGEVVDAQWFDVDNLPPLPGEYSLARHLIDDFRQRRRDDTELRG